MCVNRHRASGKRDSGGIIPAESFRDASTPLRLYMANKQPLRVGLKQIQVDLIFSSFESDTRKDLEVKALTIFYEADIDDDAILSYECFGDKGFDVCPRLHGLRGQVHQTRVWIPGSYDVEVHRVAVGPKNPLMRYQRQIMSL